MCERSNCGRHSWVGLGCSERASAAAKFIVFSAALAGGGGNCTRFSRSLHETFKGHAGSLSLCLIFRAGREENHITEPDDTLIDECCLLPSQLLIPNIDWLPINDGIISKLQNKQLVRLQFGKAPGLVGHTVSSQFDAFVRYRDLRRAGAVVGGTGVPLQLWEVPGLELRFLAHPLAAVTREQFVLSA